MNIEKIGIEDIFDYDQVDQSQEMVQTNLTQKKIDQYGVESSKIRIDNDAKGRLQSTMISYVAFARIRGSCLSQHPSNEGTH